MGNISIDEFYAKTLKNGGFGQTVLQHCICVGEIATRIAKFHGYAKIAGNELGLMCALHDIGKMSPIFQYKIGNDGLIRKLGYDVKYPSIYDLGRNERNGMDIEKDTGMHSGAGVHYFTKFINVPNGKRLRMLISRHHGFSAFGKTLDTLGRSGFAECCGDETDIKPLVLELVESLERHFGFKASDIGKLEGIDLDIVSGYLSIADWIASSKFAGIDDVSAIDFDGAVSECGFHGMQAIGRTHREMFGFDLYGYQQEVVDGIDDYGFHMLENGTGTGKTEIALATAYKLICSGKCNGLYFALPTQVTSNKIFERVEDFVGKSFKDETTDLAHSNRMQALFAMNRTKDGKDDDFLDSNRNLRLLNNVVVGTVDQLLYSVLNSKYNFIRVASLWHKVVIIDEVHCYDSFTTELIRRLKEVCLECECVVIALSATVSDTLKGKLFGASVPFLKDYPLLSKWNNGVFQQVPIKSTGVPRKFHVRIERNDDMAIAQAVAEAKSGKQILWIENTVVKAQKIYKRIAGMIRGSNVEIGLLHSHFTQHDRLVNEKKWIDLLGKNKFATDRNANGRILVATQVAEQSLDIDADKLYTSLCPIDALGQRLGRVCRFGRAVNEFEVVVLSEHSCSEYRSRGDLDWFFHASASEYSAFIYPKIVLYKTLEYLESHNTIEYPADYRSQLNKVYDEMDEIDGFDRYNDFMSEFFDDEKNSVKSARKIEADHGFTSKVEDVKTRQIVENGADTLLVKSRNGNRYTLLSGDVVDMGNDLTLSDYVRIDENTVCIKADKNVTVKEKHSDFKDVRSVEMTAFVNPNGDVEFFDSFCHSMSGYSYNGKEGLVRLK